MHVLASKIPATVLLVFSIVATEVGAADPATISLHRADGSVKITIDGQHLATYYYADEEIHRPYFAHVHAPNGIQVTRNHPPQQGDLQDHPTFHPGIWLAFGDLGGQDYWRLKAKVVHDGFGDGEAGDGGSEDGGVGDDLKGDVGFAVRNRYLSKDGSETICTEDCRYSFHIVPAGYLIVWESTFRSNAHDFYFGDQEEMGLGARVATPIREDGGNGRILSSEGVVGAGESWGSAAAWCDYTGTVDGQQVGLTIMTAPDNLRPSWWHNRDYGFFAANLFGREAMGHGAKSKLVVKKGEDFRLGYAVLVHGELQKGAQTLQNAYQDYQAIVRSARDSQPNN